MWPFLKNAKFGAQTTLFVALDPSLDKQSGLYFRYAMKFYIRRFTHKFEMISSDLKQTEVSEAAKDEKIAKWLWKVSEKWTGATY